jgi:isocitrate dehydrogenase kinase/phosphatase
MQSFSTILFARPSFLSGIARLFDFGGGLNEYNDMPTPDAADALALQADWETIGQDMRDAITTYDRQLSMSSAR